MFTIYVYVYTCNSFEFDNANWNQLKKSLICMVKVNGHRCFRCFFVIFLRSLVDRRCVSLAKGGWMVGGLAMMVISWVFKI